MKPFYIKLIALLTVFILLFSFVGCDCGGDDGENSITVRDKETYNGTHIFNAPEANGYLVKDGKSDYIIVYPESESSYVSKARMEFAYLFEKATGAKLSFSSDKNLEHADNQKYISIGQTNLLKTCGETVDFAKLGRDGGRIFTKDNNVYIVGGEDKGTLYAVYTFMQVEFNFDQYYIDCYDMDTGVSEVKLKNYDVTDIPDIPIRINSSGLLSIDYSSYGYDQSNFALRMKMGTTIYETIMPVHAEYNNISSKKKQIHNSFYYVPEEQYKDEHVKWYSDKGAQLCYTAHGDPEEYAALIEECAKKVENSLMLYTPANYPDYQVITLTMEDNYNTCNCEACTKMKATYGTDSAAPVIMINDVADKVKEWMNKPENKDYKREDFRLIFFAYQAFENAPTKYNEETKRYEAIDDKVKPRDNVGVYLAPINTADFQSGIFDENNDATRRIIDSWSSLSDYIYYWLYATNFNHYNYMFDSFNFFTSEAYAYIANRGAKYLFTQQQHNQVGTSTAWHNLKFYLDAKLSWNSSLDEAELTDKWFNAMFKEAAEQMKDLYIQERAWTRKVYSENNLISPNNVFGKIENRDLWPYMVLKSWADQCDAALKTVEGYKTTDEQAYTSLYHHITAEWVMPAYAMLKLYNNGTITPEYKAELVEKFDAFLEYIDPNNLFAVSNYRLYYRDFIDNLS